MGTKELEKEFLDQMNERDGRILTALLEDKRPVITIKKLADAIGEGCTKEQLQNAAWENHLPFGIGCRSPQASARGTIVFKDVFWRWWKTGDLPDKERPPV